MELNKKTWLKLFGLAVSILLVAFGLQHLEEIVSVLSTVCSILSPIFLGVCIAFIVNIPMRLLEKAWNALFLRHSKTGRGTRCERLRRPVCMILSILFILGLLFAVAFLLIPQLGGAFNDFSAMLPGYLSKLEELWIDLQTWLDDFGFVLPDFAIDISKLNTNGILQTAKNFFAQWGSHILDTTVSITTSVFSGVFNAVKL